MVVCKGGEKMSEQLLEKILLVVTDIQKELQDIREEQKAIREEQQAIREEQMAIREEQKTFREEINSLREEMNAFRKEQQLIREEQQALKNGQKELYDLMNALLHRQDETDAKLEALTMDVHHMRGEMTAMKQEIHTLNEKIDSHYKQFNERLNNLQLDVDFTVHKTTMTERELFKMRNRLFS
ncbi:hypothetical protein [Anoxybacillus flavithermus]|uniref:hypothetical protein n=1 Tax=Anoxybacillus flavithermus TaxID=33934 RepID=UPI00186780D4|nr:hypothetical protein [Anoxybacillus flavithermus]MBE2940610.1 hypothetical protein [Anoxybacillus flavithermus]MBE2943338.1 hypothetical protein [Anoxybacillus flavithermus]MBE2951696.1 hypothetical protein [Anoxybacillus flavithermus]MBE2954227.1 hypothetical protein [Anoxybacillus flavithermus]MBE2959676.1 hypothetical protein [Anoxybacillus flavithermus]